MAFNMYANINVFALKMLKDAVRPNQTWLLSSLKMLRNEIQYIPCCPLEMVFTRFKRFIYMHQYINKQ